MKIELELTQAEALALSRVADTYGGEPRDTALTCLREWLLAAGRDRLTRSMTYRDDPVFEPITKLPE